MSVLSFLFGEYALKAGLWAAFVYLVAYLIKRFRGIGL